jgi:hypothetical protein
MKIKASLQPNPSFESEGTPGSLNRESGYAEG